MTREEAIAEITRRLVEACQPIRVYLFGSAARGDDGPDSDLDFLVVVPDAAAEDVIRAGRLYQAVRGVGCAVDIIPWRRTDFEGRAAYVVVSLPATVVREGRLLYDAQRVAA
jgi:predicted nucleotidyltransferase